MEKPMKNGAYKLLLYFYTFKTSRHIDCLCSILYHKIRQEETPHILYGVFSQKMLLGGWQSSRFRRRTAWTDSAAKL